MLTNKFKHICVTDLDGTLLNDYHEISLPNLKALEELGRKNILRVAATGRSLFSLRNVISPEMPFDYIIFSTGAGIMNWRNQEIILARHISEHLVKQTFHKLLNIKVDFMFHAPIPENHHFIAVQNRGLADFHRRIQIYQPFSKTWEGSYPLPWNEGTQFLVVSDNDNYSIFSELTEMLAPLKVIRTTSPLDHESLWIEIFSPEVSKGSAVEYLMETLGLKHENLMVAGNDYNDEDMLKLTAHSYVTSNAPDELKTIYKVVADYTNHGFAEAVKKWLEDTSLTSSN
jgi:Cof subfamily protein (haloacid dehalogenase superfamily)